MRKSIQQDVLGTHFPQLCQEDPEEPEMGSPWGRRPPRRKMLPDRSRAARDRANQKLVEFIVRARGAEGHLRDILGNRKPSRWLKTFLKSGQYVTCVETYLEDEEQLDRVVKYLQGLCQDAGSRALARSSGDRIRFILDVLLPEVRAPRPGLQGGPPGDEPRASPACAHGDRRGRCVACARRLWPGGEQMQLWVVAHSVGPAVTARSVSRHCQTQVRAV